MVTEDRVASEQEPWSFVPMRHLRNLVTGLEATGVDSTELLGLYGLTPERLHGPYASVTVPRFRHIVRRALELSGRGSLGLVVGQRDSIADYGVAGLLMASSCRSVGEILAMSQNYEFLAQTLIRAVFRFEEHTLTLRGYPRFRLGTATRYCSDAWVAEIIAQVRLVSGNMDAAPLHLRLPYQRPEDARAYEDFCGCSVSFDHDRAEFLVPRPILEMAVIGYDPLAASGQDGGGLDTDIRSTICQAVIADPRVYSSADRITDLIGIGERQLRRYLNARGTSVREIVDEALQGLAMEYLEQTDQSVAAISRVLGYAETANFRKACRRWTGMSPRELRRRHAEAAA